MKKTLKNTFKISVLLLAFVVLSLFTVWYTQSGTRWALGFVTQHWLPELTYDSVSGSLSSDLAFDNLQYRDDSVTVTADRVLINKPSYHWLDAKLSLQSLEVGALNVLLPSDVKANSDPVQNKPWAGFEMPVALDLKQISIASLLWGDEGTVQPISDTTLKLVAEGQQWQITDLTFEAHDSACDLTLKGVTSEKLPLNLTASCLWSLDQRQWQSDWHIDGDLTQLSLEAHHQVNSPELTGDFATTGRLTDLLKTPDWQLSLYAKSLEVHFEGQRYDLNDGLVDINGKGQEFTLSQQIAVTLNQQQSVNLDWQGTGDFNQLNIQQLSLQGEPGTIQAEGAVQWSPQWHLGAEMTVAGFDTAWFHPAWPGRIDADIHAHAEENSQGQWIADVPQIHVNGELKGEPLSLQAKALWPLNGEVEGQGEFDWGDNKSTFNIHHGGIQDSSWQLEAALDWQNLALIDADLKGAILGEVAATNAANGLTMEGQLSAQGLSWQDEVLQLAQIQFSGQTQDQMTVQVDAKGLVIQGQVVDQAKIMAQGALTDHQVTVEMNGQEWGNEMALAGQYLDSGTYRAQLKQHTVSLNTISKQWQLNQATALEWSPNGLSLNNGCWQQGDDPGQLCLSWEGDAQQAQGQLNLTQFDLKPWQFLMPTGLKFDGKMNGDIAVKWQPDDVQMKGELSVNNGHWLTHALAANQEKIAITQLAITGRQINDDSAFDVQLALEDGSYLDLEAHLHADQQHGLSVTGGYKAHVANNAMVAELFDEIRSMHGQLYVEGRIHGQITKPQIAAKVELLDGDLSLRSVDVPLQHVVVNINSHEDKAYKFEAAAQAGQGQVEAKGTLYFNWGEALDWRIESTLEGDAFQAANSSEVALTVTPKLNVLVEPDQTHIQGDLLINQGHIKIKKVAESVTALPDEVVIKDQVVDATPHHLLIDVQAGIEEALPLEVLGLKAQLSGALHLKNTTKDPDIKATGTLYLKEGVYQIYGQSLQLSQGLLLFDGNLLNPSLQIRAERVVSNEQTVGVKIEGPVEGFKTTLYATPALSEAETLSYLVTGHGMEGLSGDEQSEAMAEAVLMMGLQNNSELMENLKSNLGIDVFSVSNQSELGATLEAGKNIGKKLFVGYNQGLFKHIGYWLIKYKINDKLHLETRQGEEQSVDLVYQREKK